MVHAKWTLQSTRTLSPTPPTGGTCICEQNNPFRWALALQSFSRSCYPAPDLVLQKPIFLIVLLSGGVFFHRHLYGTSEDTGSALAVCSVCSNATALISLGLSKRVLQAEVPGNTMACFSWENQWPVPSKTFCHIETQHNTSQCNTYIYIYI